MAMATHIIGWDIGGAHLKAALLNAEGRIEHVVQRPCPLWQGVGHLFRALDDALSELPADIETHAITMTGELVDCFDSREQGVKAIVNALCVRLGERNLQVFAGPDGFLAADAIENRHILTIASANWLASASLAAIKQRDALFVDLGSTTCDILVINKHRLSNVGYTDYQRLVSGELLYTGVVRTAVVAIAQAAEFNGRSMGLMAEYFATMADVYRVTGELNEAHDQSPTADGAEKTPVASARRLSRMTGYDFRSSDWPLWLNFAGYLKQKQKQMVHAACLRQKLAGQLPHSAVLIGAGVGRFLLAEVAADLGMEYRDFNDLLPPAVNSGVVDAADCAPATAVAYLAGGFG